MCVKLCDFTLFQEGDSNSSIRFKPWRMSFTTVYFCIQANVFCDKLRQTVIRLRRNFSHLAIKNMSQQANLFHTLESTLTIIVWKIPFENSKHQLFSSTIAKGGTGRIAWHTGTTFTKRRTSHVYCQTKFKNTLMIYYTLLVYKLCAVCVCVGHTLLACTTIWTTIITTGQWITILYSCRLN